jgi:hypothetical protein
MGQATIRIRSSFLWLQWVFFIFKPTISIDGATPEKHPWGESEHQVAPGQHTVHLEVPYLFTKVAKATETVTTSADQTVTLDYRPPLIVFMKGKLKLADA